MTKLFVTMFYRMFIKINSIVVTLM